MTDQVTPYIDHDPGDLITAEGSNRQQVLIKEDIAAKIAAAKEEITRTGVDRATNADKFAEKSETEWVADLNGRYAPKAHDHEGQNVYRRYIKRFTTEEGMDKVLLEHDLPRYSTVDTYKVLPVTTKEGYKDCKLLFYYGHRDAEEFGLVVRVGRGTRVPLGLPFEQVLFELNVEYDENDTIEDVLNDMWNAFWKPPNDELDHCTTPWVEECCGKRRTVADLKQADQWSDLRVAIKPWKIAFGARPATAERQTELVEVTHVNYGALLVETSGLTQGKPLDLMFLLRI